MPLSGFDRVNTELCLDFNDVRIEPAVSYLTAKDISLTTQFSTNVSLNMPFILSPATIDGAIQAAQLGGIGIMPNDAPISRQSETVRQVKRFQSRIVRNVMTVTPETSIIEALEYKQRYGIAMMPVAENGTNVLAGFLIFDDAVDYDPEKTVSHYISEQTVLMVPEEMELASVYQQMQEKQTSFAAMIDGQNRCVGLITHEDKQKAEQFPNASVDENGALRVAAMVGVGDKEFDRANALIDAGVDVIVVNAEHGHSKAALDMVTYIRRQRTGRVDVVAGNVLTNAAALALIDAGANGLIVGHSENYRTLGIGVPPFTALLNVSDAASMHNVPVTSDNDTFIDHLTKAFAAGASAAMLQDVSQHEAMLKQLRLALSYTGCATIREFNTNVRFVRAGVKN